MIRLASTIYRLALLAFPSSHRSLYTAEMTEAFELALAARRRNGGWHVLAFVIAACVDNVRAGLGERRRYQRLSALAFLGRDLSHAVRSLAKARSFSVVSVLSIGIGIGTVIASIVVLRGFAGNPPGITVEGLVELLVTRAGDSATETWTYPDFVDVRSAVKGMTIAGWTTGESVVRLPTGAAVRMDAMYVTPDYFTAMGVNLASGRSFDERESDSPAEVIIRYDVWQNRLGADPQIIGSTIVVNGTPYFVVGVAPYEFRGHLAPHRHTLDREGTGFELWLPLSHHPRLVGPESLQYNRDADWLHVVGRLSPGMSIADANGAVSSVMAGLAEQHPGSNARKSASVEPYFSLGARRRFDTQIESVAGMVVSGMVLLVVCLNVSGMVLVRAGTRERELAVRLAVGASRARLMQYLLAEALVLATLGGVLGALVIFGTPSAVTWWFGQPLDIELQPDATIIAACAALCFATSLVFGMLPAVRFSRPKIISALKAEAGCGSRRVGRVHRATAAIQAGFAVPLLVICGVVLHQVRTTATVDLGFKPAGLYYLPINLAVDGRDGDPAFLLRNARNNLERASGVAAVALADGFPLDSDYRDARIARDGTNEIVRAETTAVSPRFLETIGARILRGREITSEDQIGRERVAVISEPLAAKLFPNAEPLGRRLTFALDGNTAHSYVVVGITADLVASSLGSKQPQLFVALAQHPATQVFVMARSSLPSAAMAATFENAFTDFGLEPDVIRSNLRTAENRLKNSRTELAMASIASGVAGVVALLLAALGVFGVVGFMVATRTREIGVRIALGASRTQVLRGVLWDALKLAVPGVVGGLLVAIPLVDELSMYSLGLVEPVAYVVAAAITLGIALLAGLPAARRAAAVEPMTAMRAE